MLTISPALLYVDRSPVDGAAAAMNRYLASGIAVLSVTLTGCASTPMLTAKNTPLCGEGTVPTVTQPGLTPFFSTGG